MNEVPLARPEWNHEEYFREKFKDVTILICQRKTRDLIQLCVTSILNHYPEINILVVDGHSEDDSIEWLRFISAKHPNVKVWERPEAINSHGQTMDEAITQFITTKYILLMDSDTIVRRGGFVEGILEKFSFAEIEEKNLYAVGSLMIQSIKGEACSPPESEEDKLYYAHPSCSMYNVEIYKTLRSFTDHGAPCALNNIDAQEKGYLIEYFPVDKYVQHLGGASWQEVCTVWNDDGDVQVRPLITFISGYVEDFQLNENDFNICLNILPTAEKPVSTYDRGQLKTDIGLYDIRFNVNGHYVIEHSFGNRKLPKDFISLVRKHPIENEFEIAGIKVYERKYWQKYISIK